MEYSGSKHIAMTDLIIHAYFPVMNVDLFELFSKFAKFTNIFAIPQLSGGQFLDSRSQDFARQSDVRSYSIYSKEIYLSMPSTK